MFYKHLAAEKTRKNIQYTTSIFRKEGSGLAQREFSARAGNSRIVSPLMFRGKRESVVFLKGATDREPSKNNSNLHMG